MKFTSMVLTGSEKYWIKFCMKLTKGRLLSNYCN